MDEIQKVMLFKFEKRKTEKEKIGKKRKNREEAPTRAGPTGRYCERSHPQKNNSRASGNSRHQPPSLEKLVEMNRTNGPSRVIES
jgi:hypothetical protein